jgi:hypothetical protein
VRRGEEEESLGAFLEERRAHLFVGLRRKPLLELRLLEEVFHGGLTTILERAHILWWRAHLLEEGRNLVRRAHF